LSARFLSQLAIAGLILVGSLGMYLRFQSRQAAEEALQDSKWRLAYAVDFKAEVSQSEARIALPFETPYIEIVHEELGTGILPDNVVTVSPSGTRELVVFTNVPNDYTVTAEIDLRLRPGGRYTAEEYLNLSADARAIYLREEPELPVGRDPVRKVLQQSADEWTQDEQKLQWIFNFCRRDLARVAAGTANDSVLGALLNSAATPLARARTMVTLCRAAGLPSRLVSGFIIEQGDNVQQHVWVEVFRGNRWYPFDPESGYGRGGMPANYLPVRRGGENLFKTGERAAVTNVVTRYSITPLDPPSEVLDAEKPHPSQIFDLTRLPVVMHEVLSLLLLLPFGALISSFLRNVVGVRTFGTFAPALFAISFVYGDWRSGLIVLFVVLIAGLTGRVLVERLRLLMVPRLSILLTTIILCVVFGVSALDYINMAPSAQAVLLPLVILTILIERFYVTVEEDGFSFALSLTLGTLLVATCCYLLLSWRRVGELILIYPEAHLLTLAAFVAIGRYAGYRLTELFRFRDLVKAEQASRN
jgi:transglutaminase-like putative cysteine protease